MTWTTLILTAGLSAGADPCAPNCGTDLLSKFRNRNTCQTRDCVPCGTPLFQGLGALSRKKADATSSSTSTVIVSSQPVVVGAPVSTPLATAAAPCALAPSVNATQPAAPVEALPKSMPPATEVPKEAPRAMPKPTEAPKAVKPEEAKPVAPIAPKPVAPVAPKPITPEPMNEKAPPPKVKKKLVQIDGIMVPDLLPPAPQKP